MFRLNLTFLVLVTVCCVGTVVTAADNKLKEAERKLHEVERKLQDAEHRAQEAERKADTAERRAKEAEHRAAQYPATLPRHPQHHEQPSVSTVTLEGTVEAIGTMGFTVNASEDQPNKKNTSAKGWFIAPTHATTWLIQGMADVNYLKRGQTVIFKSMLDEQSQPVDKISALTIVPASGNNPGITADDGSGPIHPKDPGVGGVQPPANDIKKVIGKITSCGPTKLVVGAGKEVHVELAVIPTVNIALSDPKLMVVGAKVTIHGTAMKTKNGRYCEADDIKVTLVQPLTGTEKSSGSTSQKTTTTKDDTSDDKDADKAAEDKAPAEAK